METFEIERPFQNFPIDNKNKSTLTIRKDNQIIEWKKCVLYLKNIKYILIIEYQTDNLIYFYIKQDNDKIEEFYMKSYESSMVQNMLDLGQNYNNPKIIFDFFADLLDKEKINLEKDDSRKEMRLLFKREGQYFGDSEYHIRLTKYENDGYIIFKKLLSEMNKDKEKNNKKEKENNNNRNNNSINNLLPKNKQSDAKVKQLEENINEIKLESKEEYKMENNNKNEILPKSAELINFTENPDKLKYDCLIATNVSSADDELNNFDVFIGVKDNNYYLAYGSPKNNNIEILNIFDQNVIKSLHGHYMRISVIKYYLNNIKEEYILSCDINSKAIIWDVANDYSIKYILRMYDTGIIKDAILLFNIYKKNYLVISRNNKTEFTKLYELTKDTPFIRDIYNSHKNFTYKVIPWKQNDDYYIIELCKGFISIKNLLEDKTYSYFKLDKDDIFLSGLIYKDKLLVANISNKKAILIMDLLSKEQKNLINYQYSCNSICYWNDKYIIILGMKFEFFDFENQKIDDKKIDVTNVLLGVKKIKSPFFGEALVVVDDKKNFIIYSLFNK